LIIVCEIMKLMLLKTNYIIYGDIMFELNVRLST